MAKKVILILILISIICTNIFAAGYPVIDVSVLLQTLLDKMQTAEHFVKEIEQWKQVLEHYKRQYEQIKRYYEELKGIAEKYASCQGLVDYWNNTKAMLNKLIDINKAQGQLEDQLFKDGIKIINYHTKNVEAVLKIGTGESDFEKAKLEQLERWERRIDYYQDTFTSTIRHTQDVITKREKQKEDSLQYWYGRLENAQRVAAEIQVKISDSGTYRDELRVLIAPYREYRAILVDTLRNQKTAQLSFEIENMETLKKGNQTEGQRAENLQQSASFEYQIQTTERMLEDQEEIISNFDDKINLIEDDIHSLERTYDELVAEITYCQQNIDRITNTV